ncbi:MAG: GNAT family N-acetyltransferase [Alphaproteobacteria bacterium]
MSKPHVRRARRGDAPAVVEMSKAPADWLGNKTPVIDEAAVLRNCFGRERWAHFLIATVDGAAVGYTIFCPTFEGHIGRRRIYMSDLFVRPETRGSDAGRALMAAVARHAIANDCLAVTWELWDQNTLGRTVYERMGCVVSEDVNSMHLEGEALAALAGGEVA